MRLTLKDLAGAVAVCIAAVAPAMAQTWPERPITVIVPWAAGGGTDPLARMIFADLSERLGQPVVIDFRPGAAGTIGSAYAAGTDPDGYTLLFTSPAPIINANFMPGGVPYSPQGDFVPVIQATFSPQVVAAHSGFGPNTFAELIEYARANPGKVNAAISGLGGVSHQGTAMIQYQAGVEFNVVPYTGVGAMVPDLLGGSVDIGTGFLAGFLSGLQGGHLKILAPMSTERMREIPDVPSTAEQGFPQILTGAWFTLFAPTGTPREVIDRLNAEINAFLATEEGTQGVHNLGYDVTGGTPEDALEWILSDLEAFRALNESGAFDMN